LTVLVTNFRKFLLLLSEGSKFPFGGPNWGVVKDV